MCECLVTKTEYGEVWRICEVCTGYFTDRGLLLPEHIATAFDLMEREIGDMISDLPYDKIRERLTRDGIDPEKVIAEGVEIINKALATARNNLAAGAGKEG